MPKFQKLPVIVEAFQLPLIGEDPAAFVQWAESLNFDGYTSERDGCIAIQTLEGVMTGEPGDWIIQGVNGEFYPCKPDIFAKTYTKLRTES